jgi:hypothetical protein
MITLIYAGWVPHDRDASGAAWLYMARVSDCSLYRRVASRILLSALGRSDHDMSVAQMKPTNSRATAVAATCGGRPRPVSRR